MKVIDNLEEFWLEHESVLTIGVFDGVHRGHQALVHRVVESARATGRQSGVVTFYPHPDTVLTPERAVRCITTPGEKAAILEQLAVDMMVLLQFTLELANLLPKQFVELLVNHLHPAEIWVGADFTFGRKGKGNATVLKELGRQMGFDVHVLAPVQYRRGVVSSSRIREMLAAGDMESVTEMLGRYYLLVGEVVLGQKQRGHELGFPTANLKVRSERALPRDGVYAGFALLGKERFPAVANLGIRPTFDNETKLLEVHLLDADIDLYGCDLGVEFVHWMRPELKFDSVDDLITQIKRDVAEARQLLHDAKPKFASSNWTRTET